MSQPSRISGALRTIFATLGKCALALVVFMTIFGGWQWVMARQPLPGASDREGSCVLWFVGSSTMSRWGSLQADMRPWIAQNRGIGGATMQEINLHIEHDKAKKPPQAIVYYAGENDLAFGHSVDQALADLREFLAIKTRMFGQTPVFLISLKPSPTRWDRRADQARYNVVARQIADARPDAFYIDIVPLLMEGDAPGPFYTEDGLHMNDLGYRRWTQATQRALDTDLPRPVLDKCNPKALARS